MHSGHDRSGDEAVATARAGLDPRTRRHAPATGSKQGLDNPPDDAEGDPTRDALRHDAPGARDRPPPRPGNEPDDPASRLPAGRARAAPVRGGITQDVQA